jgi:segregation and condensation protein B
VSEGLRMSDADRLPELKEIVGAVLFTAKSPVTLEQLHALMARAAEQVGGPATRQLAGATREDVQAAVDALRADIAAARVGLTITEVAHGYRIENEWACGPWLRAFLEKARPNRLSPPALETLAIIAYRQPVMRSEIESVRGVAVDQILRNLLDMQLIRIVGRSDLPGRPWLFGTTQKFLEHFGLRSLDDLPGTDELKRFPPAAPTVVERGPAAASAPPPAFNAAALAAETPASGDDDDTEPAELSRPADEVDAVRPDPSLDITPPPPPSDDEEDDDEADDDDDEEYDDDDDDDEVEDVDEVDDDEVDKGGAS